MVTSGFQKVPAVLAVRFRQRLQAARATALGDAEGYTDLLVAIEELGRYIQNNPDAHGLGAYIPGLAGLAESASSPDSSFPLLLHALREARNDAIHLGAAARRITQQATTVAIVLEDALANQAGLKLVKHYMVEHPTAADPFETIGMVRQTLLRQQFSALPYLNGQSWSLITDLAIVRFLGGEERKKRLTMTVAQAVEMRLELTAAPTVGPGSNVASLLKPNAQLPVLVVEGSNLCGIITAFDLL
jgi:CBS domain-containing protein